MFDRSPPGVCTTGDGSCTLYSHRYRQTYHSRHGAVTESRHVFLRGAGLIDRIHTEPLTRMLEVGLGTGLNFLLTASEALRAGMRLEYWALEHELIAADTFEKLHYDEYIEPAELHISFSEWLGQHRPPEETLLTYRYSDSLTLYVIYGDATQADLPGNTFHAAYLDAFSPDVNPELWSVVFLKTLYAAMAPGSRLTTYSARRTVRDNLTSAGFEVHKNPGPPGKREMVVAYVR